MSALDLAAVCKRHEITTDRDPFCVEPHAWEAWFVGSYAESSITGTTEADAVCALLKTRWGITTTFNPYAEWPWHAETGSTIHDIDVSRDTELAAVVALADRLLADETVSVR